jgi:hypothetical protein
MPETYKSFATILGSTAATIIYSGSSGTGIVNSINCSNASTSTANTITIEILKGSTAYSLITSGAVPTSTAFQVLDSPVILETNDTLQATAGFTAPIHILVSVLEIT